MGYHPEVDRTKGIEVDEDVLIYKATDENGHTIFARCLGWVNDVKRGLRHAWVLHPRYGVEQMTPEEGRIAGFTPVRVVLREKYDEDVAALQERITALETFVKSVQEARAAKVPVKELAPESKPEKK